MKPFLLICALLCAGCSTFFDTDLGRRTVEQVQRGVDRYCDVIDAEDRSTFRENVNPTPNGNSIRVDCAADPSASIQ